MTDIAIQAEGLGKQYRIGQREPYKTFREALVKMARAPWRRRGRHGNGRGEERNLIWALRDVSFEVRRGEVLGLIGHNGAGKSTLLKVLSRITEPTCGVADVYGRVGSLLEVGTGFHHELTGRENIYLNGALLGMRKVEIDRKFDEIVAFSEIERFIDTPVKRYSSGMYMRLAFAVAAHLEPEILLVDEVLAVGDAAFQKKCLGKMGDVATAGRTVLLVSHNMAAIKSLCQRAVLLTGGQIAATGPAAEMVERYLQMVSESVSTPLGDREDRGGDGSARLTSIRIAPAEGDGAITPNTRLRITVGYESDQPLLNPRFVVAIQDTQYAGVYYLASDYVGGVGETLPARGQVSCATEPIHITPGRCYVTLSLQNGRQLADHVYRAAAFDVEMDDFYGTGKLAARDRAVCLLRHSWEAHTNE